MNPRDMDAFYDAAVAYMEAKASGVRDRTWHFKADATSSESSRNFAREVLGKWKIDPDADERAWVRDLFKQQPTCWTEERDRYPRFAPKRTNRYSRNEELQLGDTTELDSFLAGFSTK